MEVRNKTTKNRGYSLIEMIVVIAMIVIILGMALPGYQGGKQQYLLDTTAQQIMADIRRTQSMAIVAQEMKIGPQAGSVPVGGYGIQFIEAEPEYYIFADISADYGRYSSGDLVVEAISLPSNVEIFQIKPAYDNKLTNFNITFVPPEPKTNFFETDDSVVRIKIKIKGTDDDRYERSIRVTNGGVIQVD